jgi:uncharacterized Zn finger protein
MAKKLKEICKWDKGSFEKNLPELIKVVSNPQYACKSCGRVSHAKKHVCKPLKFPAPPEKD